MMCSFYVSIFYRTHTKSLPLEVLREGDFGDEHVKVEDALITTTLDGYVGAEQKEMKRAPRVPRGRREESRVLLA